MTPVRLEPAALRSRVKHSTTEPLRTLDCFDNLELSLNMKCMNYKKHCIVMEVGIQKFNGNVYLQRKKSLYIQKALSINNSDF